MLNDIVLWVSEAICIFVSYFQKRKLPPWDFNILPEAYILKARLNITLNSIKYANPRFWTSGICSVISDILYTSSIRFEWYITKQNPRHDRGINAHGYMRIHTTHADISRTIFSYVTFNLDAKTHSLLEIFTITFSADRVRGALIPTLFSTRPHATEFTNARLCHCRISWRDDMSKKWKCALRTFQRKIWAATTTWECACSKFSLNSEMPMPPLSSRFNWLPPHVSSGKHGKSTVIKVIHKISITLKTKKFWCYEIVIVSIVFI